MRSEASMGDELQYYTLETLPSLAVRRTARFWRFRASDFDDAPTVDHEWLHREIMRPRPELDAGFETFLEQLEEICQRRAK